MKKIVGIGDPHGCLEELKELLDKINYDSNVYDIHILGDILDRGPLSIETLRFVKEMGFKCVLGNHDESHLRYYKHKKKQEQNPSYKIPMRQMNGLKLAVQNSLTEEDIEFLDSLPSYIEINNKWVFVHAGLEPGKTLENQDPHKLTHLRYLNLQTLKPVTLGENYEPPPNSDYWTKFYKGPHNVVYGHNVHQLDLPEIQENFPGIKTFGIDTGCVFDGCLTSMIIDLETNEYNFQSVKAKKVYYDKNH